jgi:hypothetical protein
LGQAQKGIGPVRKKAQITIDEIGCALNVIFIRIESLSCRSFGSHIGNVMDNR